MRVGSPTGNFASFPLTVPGPRSPKAKEITPVATTTLCVSVKPVCACDRRQCAATEGSEGEPRVSIATFLISNTPLDPPGKFCHPSTALQERDLGVLITR